MGKKRTSKAKRPDWPARVQALLTRYDLTHEQLGSRLGVSRTNISQFLHARRTPPRPIQKLIAMMEDGDDLSRVLEI